MTYETIYICDHCKGRGKKSFRIRLTIGDDYPNPLDKKSYDVCSYKCLLDLIYVHEKDIIKHRRLNKEKGI